MDYLNRIFAWAVALPPVPKLLFVVFIGVVMAGVYGWILYGLYYAPKPTASPPEIPAPPTAAEPPSKITSPSSRREPPSQPRTAPQGPIEWYFSSSDPTIFGWNESSDGAFLVGTFNIRGKNTSGEPITRVDAFVLPQISNSKLQLKYYDPRETELLETKNYFVQPDAEFQLSYKIPSYDKDKSLQGVPVDLFLSRYGGIKFMFNYNDAKSITYEFTYAIVKEYLSRQQEQHDERRKPQPGVRRIDR
jgi:hypothetical protein